ncbi:hypothetical protein V1511DRAFT_502928 [Dipodascopsis uninucleata]
MPESKKRDWFSLGGELEDDYRHSDSENDIERTKSSVKSTVKSTTKQQKKRSRHDEDALESTLESRSGATGKLPSRSKRNALSEFSKAQESDSDEYDDNDMPLSSKNDNYAEEADEIVTSSDRKYDEDDVDEDGNTKGVLRLITVEELESYHDKIEKSGVVYLSRIPPYMKPSKVRQILSRFGEVDRVFLAPEDPKAYAKRVRFGGNKKRKFIEGWVEFKNKKKAKLAASTLNGNIVGGRKGSYYYDDILNIKYLPKFKWHHLTEQIAYENQARQAKLRAEISQATRENKAFIRNVERAKMIEHIQEKKKKRTRSTKPELSEDPTDSVGDIDIRRNFKQRNVNSRSNVSETSTKNSEGETKLKNVLSKIFA